MRSMSKATHGRATHPSRKSVSHRSHPSCQKTTHACRRSRTLGRSTPVCGTTGRTQTDRTTRRHGPGSLRRTARVRSRRPPCAARGARRRPRSRRIVHPRRTARTRPCTSGGKRRVRSRRKERVEAGERSLACPGRWREERERGGGGRGCARTASTRNQAREAIAGRREGGEGREGRQRREGAARATLERNAVHTFR